MAMMISLALRAMLLSWDRKRLRASCWVMVLAPWTLPFSTMSIQRAVVISASHNPFMDNDDVVIPKDVYKTKNDITTLSIKALKIGRAHV